MNDEKTPALREAVENMANMREAYNNLSQAAEAYNTGKGELAANIAAKGVQASATETLPELAEKVNAISQETIEINGGEMYAKQLFGSLEIPNYWNLYEVLANLLSDGRLVSYGGILLAEYYRGYDSLSLAGAGAGGAYVVSDKDENGQFKMYTNDTTHVWDTEFDGKGNRWVAYCFADEYHDFQITDTNTSPRSIFIGRKVGTITCLATSRTAQIVVPDGNDLIAYDSNNFVSNFDRKFILRNAGIKKSLLYRNTIDLAYIELSHDNEGAIVQTINNDGQGSKCLIVKSSIELQNIQILSSLLQNGKAQTEVLIIDADGNFTVAGLNLYGNTLNPANMKEFNVVAEQLNLTYGAYPNPKAEYYLPNGCKVILSYRTNDKTKSVSLIGNAYSLVQDLLLKTGWCKTLNIAAFHSLTKENVQAHIFDRLGVNDLSTGAVTITLENAVLNLFTQEEIDAVVARTNITIVGA